MPKKHPLKRLWHYITPHRRTITLAATFSIFNKIFDFASPMLIGDAVDMKQGTHEQLVALDNIYAGLWRVQTGERVPQPT